MQWILFNNQDESRRVGVNVNVRLFSIAKDLAGLEQLVVKLDEGALADDVVRHLESINPQFSAWKESIRLAVNYEYVAHNHPLREGDEVAVIPPVSGG